MWKKQTEWSILDNGKTDGIFFSLQENKHLATVKIVVCDGWNRCNCTPATVFKPSMICVSQQHFATVFKTVVATVAIVVATVSNCPYVFSHVVILNLIVGVATVTKPSQTVFFLKKKY
jgi:hypothetical protein